MDDLFTCDARCLEQTDDAMLLVLKLGAWEAQEWIPRSCIHETSEVYGREHLAGRVVMSGFIARKKGLTTESPPRRHLDLSGHYSPSTASLIITIVRAMAAAKKLERPTHDAICECDDCQSGELHPSVRHELGALESVLSKLEEATKR